MASKTENVKLGVCRVTFDGNDLGYTKGGVEVEVQTETAKVDVDQFGKTPINEVIMTRTVTVKAPLAETTVENMVAIMPGAVLTATGGVKATGTVTFSTSPPSANDTITINGVVFTFKSSNPVGNEILIGGTITATAANAVAVLNASTDPKVSAASYSNAAGVMTVTYDLHGIEGNDFTLAKNGTNIAVSGATLTGGVNATKKKVVVPVSTGTDLLALAKKLVLHPIAKPDSDKSEDFVIPKAMTPGALQFAYKLDEQRVYNVSFMGYPDATTGTLFVVGDESAT